MKKFIMLIIVTAIAILFYQDKKPFLGYNQGIFITGLSNRGTSLYCSAFTQHNVNQIEKMKQTILNYLNTAPGNVLDKEAFKEMIETRPEMVMGYIMGMESAIITHKNSSAKEKEHMEQIAYHMAHNFVPIIAQITLSADMYKQVAPLMHAQ